MKHADESGGMCSAYQMEQAIEHILFSVLDADDGAYDYWYPESDLEVIDE